MILPCSTAIASAGYHCHHHRHQQHHPLPFTMIHFTFEKRMAIVAGCIAVVALIAAVFCKWIPKYFHRGGRNGGKTKNALHGELGKPRHGLINFKDLLPLVPSIRGPEEKKCCDVILQKNYDQLDWNPYSADPMAGAQQSQTRESISSSSTSSAESGELSPSSRRQVLLCLQDSSSSPSTATSDCDGHAIGNNPVLEISLTYDCVQEKLTVFLLRARRIPPNIYGGTSDSYVQVILGKDMRRYWKRRPDPRVDSSDSRSSSPIDTTHIGYKTLAEFQTRVVRKDVEPLFKERFVIEGLKKNEMKKSWLKFVLRNVDRFHHHSIAGTRLIDIEEALQEDVDSFPLHLDRYMPKLGEITLSLCYMPTAARLAVKVMKITGLMAPNGLATANPYVKGLILRRGKVLEKHSTSPKFRELNPTFPDEPLVYDIPHWELEKVVLLIAVYHHDAASFRDAPGHIHRRRSTGASPDEEDESAVDSTGTLSMRKSHSSNHVPRKDSVAMGRLAFGSLAVIDPATKRHWAEVITNPRKYITRTHKLRP